MPIDLKETYQTLSNEALLQIIANPAHSRQEAATASSVLAERGISADEIQTAISGPPVTDTNNPGTQYEEGATDIFGEMQPVLSAPTRKRVRIICITWGVLCLLNTAVVNLSLITMFRYGFDVTVLAAMLVSSFFILLPLYFISLLYRHRYWGWLLSAGALSYYTIADIGNGILLGTAGMWSTGADSLLLLVSLAVHTTCLVLLFGRQVREDFSVTTEIMWRPVAVAGALAFFQLFLSQAMS